VDRDNPDIFYFREGWADQASLDQHDKTPHVMAIRQSEKELTANGITVNFMHAL